MEGSVIDTKDGYILAVQVVVTIPSPTDADPVPSHLSFPKSCLLFDSDMVLQKRLSLGRPKK